MSYYTSVDDLLRQLNIPRPKQEAPPTDFLLFREWLERRIIKEPNSGCWIWILGCTSLGYGRLRNISAHRLTYIRFRGNIAEDKVLDHLCRNPSCVNPRHLEEVSQRVNVLRGVGVAAKFSQRIVCKEGHFLPTVFDKKNCRPCSECAAIRNRKLRERYKITGLPRARPFKSHCLRDHEMTSDNTYTSPMGARFCRKCLKIRADIRKEKGHFTAAYRNARKKVTSRERAALRACKKEGL